MKLGGLIRRIFPHRAWPYPRGEREVRQVIIVTLCIIFITLIGIIAGLKYQDEKTLHSRDIYLAAKDMTSYSNEAYSIATKSQDQSLVGPYRQVYIQQLANDVSQTKDKLATHESAENIRQKASKLTDICDQLSDILDTLTRDPSDQVFAAHTEKLQQLARQAKAIEDTL